MAERIRGTLLPPPLPNGTALTIKYSPLFGALTRKGLYTSHEELFGGTFTDSYSMKAGEN